MSGIVEHKFCKDQSFTLTTVQRKTSTNLHKNACSESTVATPLLTEDSIKNFLREFYTNFFRGMTLATLISEKILVTSSIVFWKKLYCFEDLWWNTFHPFRGVLN